MKVALVHDWLTGMRGGEKVLEVLCDLFPNAEIFTLFHNRGSVSRQLEKMDITTSFIQNFPGRNRYYRNYLFLFPIAVEQFCLDKFDLVISSSHCVAKGVLVRPGTCHICYCHTPMRYIWDQYFIYFGHGRLKGLKKILIPYISHKLRIWDVSSSGRVDFFVANSRHVAGRIKRVYGRDSEVISPPVEVSRFSQISKSKTGKNRELKEEYFLIVSALVPYKKIDLAVHAFNRMGRLLVIVGSGPEESKLKKTAKSNIRFMGYCSDDDLTALYSGCLALIFPGEEDFGITAVEAHAAGKPVIAFFCGGVSEIVTEGKTGIFFHESTVSSLIEAVERGEKTDFNSEQIKKSALTYDKSLFKSKMKAFILDKYQTFQ